MQGMVVMEMDQLLSAYISFAAHPLSSQARDGIGRASWSMTQVLVVNGVEWTLLDA